MTSWVRRVSNLLSKDSSARPTVPPDTATPSSLPVPERRAPVPLADLDGEVFAWMLDQLPATDHPAHPDELRWLDDLDALIVADKGRGELLPRAAGLIPQLLNSLRDEGQSAGVLAQRVSRDPNLVAEVTRLANSLAFRGHEPVVELADAVRRVGTAGLRQAIAKVVLKPMFGAQPGQLSTRAATRTWAHSQAQADLCRALAQDRGLDPFEAYLGGLLYDVGWTAGWRALDHVFEKLPPPAGLAFSRGFRQAFQARRERLFSQFVIGWKLSAPLHAAARAVKSAGGFEHADDALAQVLLAGNRLAARRVLVSAGRVAEDPDQVAHWSEPVQAAYSALA